ncbi:hypothetical protein [Oceaniglobus ichthyenteri]|uniref:hypothetical protein n=1 Tax=Oceaniglobus ichthyenteri TaxID=2136177 RepID=UPI000D34DFC3|nr:hypothetical protein [Oceaniglobus ichthyenteri]
MAAPHLPKQASDLRLPLRDLMRGARRTLSLPEAALKPALGILPGPVGDILHRMSGLLPDFESAGQPASRADIDLVCQGLAGVKGRNISRAFARVLAHGMERVLDQSGDTTLLISETLAAIAFGALRFDQGAGDDVADAAAQLWLALDAGHVIGVVPGTPIAINAADSARIHSALHALVLWLLTERPDDPSQEDDILALCAAFASVTEAERSAALATPETLAQMVRQHAVMI